MFLSNISRCLVKLTTGSNVQLSGSRLYSRWTHRRPSRVILQSSPTSLKQEEIISLDPEVVQTVPTNQRENIKITSEKKNKSKIQQAVQNFSSIKHNENEDIDNSPDFKSKPRHVDGENVKKKRAEAMKITLESLSKDSVFDDQGELVYHKLKDNDGRVSNILTNLKSKNGRSRTDQMLVEGRRLIVDGLQANCKLRYLIFSRVTDLDPIKPHLPQKGVKIFKIPYKDISLWSHVDTSSGLLGVFEMPKAENIKIQGQPLPLQVICDNVRDPGNLGAILRASVGVGCKGVYLMKGCVDLWDPKVIRSAAGAHFRLPIHSSLEWPKVQKLIDPVSSVVIADNNNFKVQFSNNTSRGGDVQQQDETESLESLNVPVVPYYSVDYTSFDSVTLIIGGETEGISEESYRFAAERSGVRVNIPLQKGVDSLNTGMATAVIAFEIKKQILEARRAQKAAAQQ